MVSPATVVTARAKFMARAVERFRRDGQRPGVAPSGDEPYDREAPVGAKNSVRTLETSPMRGSRIGTAMMAILGLSGAGLFLAGCVSEQRVIVANAAQSGPVQANGAPPRPAFPAGQPTITRTAIAGATTRINFSVSLNPDCSVRSIPVTRVLQQPVHGIVQIVERDDYPLFLPTNIHYACNKNKVHGSGLDYIADAGFVGNDYFSFEIINDNGEDRVFKMVMAVK
jgi:hypothetical protein